MTPNLPHYHTTQFIVKLPIHQEEGYQYYMLQISDSSLCQNGKQVEIITKMIFELCYIEAIIQI